MRHSQKSVSDYLVKGFPFLLALGVLYLLYQQVVVHVAPGYGAVLTQGKHVELLNPGFHLKWPFFSRVEFINLRLLNYEVNVEGYSKDLQLIRGKVNLLLTLNPDTIADAYQKMSNPRNFIPNIFIPTVKAAFQTITSNTEAKDWILNREIMANQFQQKMQSEMSQMLQPLPLEEVVQLKGFSLSELRLPSDLLKMWQANARSETLIRNIQREADALKGNEIVLSLRTIEKLNDSFASSNLVKSVISTNLNLSTSSPALPRR